MYFKKHSYYYGTIVGFVILAQSVKSTSKTFAVYIDKIGIIWKGVMLLCFRRWSSKPGVVSLNLGGGVS